MTRIVVLLAAALAAGACSGKETAARSREGAQRAFETASVEKRDGAGRTAIEGVVVGRVEAVLSSRLAAAVASVAAVPGTTVRAGTVLVRLEEKETSGALEGARAALEAARASLDLAKKNRARFEKLAARGAAAAMELDRARQDEASALAASALAQAAVRRAEADRGQAVLEAPFDAVVVEKMVSTGDLAAPGRPLVRLASLSGRRVEAAPGEEQAATLKPGMALDVEVAGRTVAATVAEIAGAVDPATRRRAVRLDLPPGFEPPVGSFARLFLPGRATAAIYAPERAVAGRGGLEIAWVVRPDGRAELRYVRTGARSGGSIEIRSGLEAGERVILDPPADLEAGTRVTSS